MESMCQANEKDWYSDMPHTPKIIGNSQLYLGDCAEVFPLLRGYVDAVITDPPYGVEFKGKRTKHGTKHPDRIYRDDNFKEVVLPRIEMMIAVAKRTLVFSGTRRLQEYPRTEHVGGIICPNGAGSARWGFNCYHPALLYGEMPEATSDVPSLIIVKSHSSYRWDAGEDNDHPCPKPIPFMEWAIKKATIPGEVILDPFMGSGTTGVACVMSGRPFVGVEIDPNFFQLAVQRIEEAHAARGEVQRTKRRGLVF